MELSKKLEEALSEMVLSVSGFRKVFALNGEQDKNPEISAEDSLICTAIAKAFFDVVKPVKVLLAQDSRPTGNAICSVMGKTLKTLNVNVCYAGICSAPEAMAESQISEYDAFVYVSASHNPIGYNGVKFGCNGGVFKNEIASEIISALRETVKNVPLLNSLVKSSDKQTLAVDENLKLQCLKHYDSFIEKESFEGLGIVADLNGSARCLSIDKSFLESLGFKVRFINDRAGEIAHEIVPEGKNLDACRAFLEKVHNEDSSFVFGYVPDNDGDRGNLVYINKEGKAEILKAQDVFALCLYSTLKHNRNKGIKNLAVAYNGPTSMRCDMLCEQLGVKYFRSEVGEANVVLLGEELRSKGYSVPFLGEGSNGGNITYPSKVRDPLNTVIAVARLIKGGKSIADVLDEIPSFITTDSFDNEGVVRLKTNDWLSLKQNYVKLFEKQFYEKEQELRQFGLVEYEFINTEGTVERIGSIKTGRSGLKVLFYNKENVKTAYIWMRPSGTEPLLRISADVSGKNNKLYNTLINWQRSLILSAASQLCD